MLRENVLASWLASIETPHMLGSAGTAGGIKCYFGCSLFHLQYKRTVLSCGSRYSRCHVDKTVMRGLSSVCSSSTLLTPHFICSTLLCHCFGAPAAQPSGAARLRTTQSTAPSPLTTTGRRGTQTFLRSLRLTMMQQCAHSQSPLQYAPPKSPYLVACLSW